MSRMHRRARELRRDATDVERRLWARLRDRQLGGAKFRRQQPIGGYVVDFVCLRRRLVVELDGGQHSADDPKEIARARFLEAEGYRVLRFWNNEVVENLDGVLEAIWAELKKPTPPSP